MKPAMLRDITASLMTLVALGALVYVAVILRNEAALGALIATQAAATGWYLRGRVEAPSN